MGKLSLQRIEFALKITLLRIQLSSLSVMVSGLFPQKNLLSEISNDLVLVAAASLELADSFLSELDDHLVSRALLLIALQRLLDPFVLEL